MSGPNGQHNVKRFTTERYTFEWIHFIYKENYLYVTFHQNYNKIICTGNICTLTNLSDISSILHLTQPHCLVGVQMKSKAHWPRCPCRPPSRWYHDHGLWPLVDSGRGDIPLHFPGRQPVWRHVCSNLQHKQMQIVLQIVHF